MRAGIKRCEVVRVVRGTGWTHRDVRAGASRSWPIGAVVDDCVPPATPHHLVSNGHRWFNMPTDSRDTMIGAVRQVRVWPRRPASASSAHCRHGGDGSPSLADQAEHHGRSTTAAHAPGAGRVPLRDCISLVAARRVASDSSRGTTSGSLLRASWALPCPLRLAVGRPHVRTGLRERWKHAVDAQPAASCCDRELCSSRAA